MQKLSDTALLCSLPVAIVGALFKINHFPYANQMLILGLSSVGLAGFIKYSAEKTPEGYATGVTIFLFCVAFLFKILHFEGARELIEATIISGLVLGVIMLFFRKEKKDDSN